MQSLWWHSARADQCLKFAAAVAAGSSALPVQYSPAPASRLAKPTSTMAETQKLTITSSDQHRFDASLHPTDDPAAPLLIFLSAMGAPARVYGRFAREVVKHGVQVCTPDWRGIASSSMRAGRSWPSISRPTFGRRSRRHKRCCPNCQAVRQFSGNGAKLKLKASSLTTFPGPSSPPALLRLWRSTSAG